MQIAVTGADGFIGKNLVLRLSERGFHNILKINRETPPDELKSNLLMADFVFHLAGVNRPKNQSEFTRGNTDFTRTVCDILAASEKRATIVFASSKQALMNNHYGASKLAAEDAVTNYAKSAPATAFIFRLTNVFGKWARPNYNSVVATFCYNIANDIDIQVNDPASELELVYIDDVVSGFFNLLEQQVSGEEFCEISPIYQTTVGEVAAIIKDIADSRSTLISPLVGTGLVRALHSTYLSYLSPNQFTYDLPRYADPRGVFVEMLKTPDCGQFSYFTSLPGITRGEHYHHSKTEKFLVIQGNARFRFRNIMTGEKAEVFTNGDEAKIVETVPGWTHDVTNIGPTNLIVMLWANEVFDRSKPDTYSMKVIA